MTPELDAALVRDFPKLYRLRHRKRHRGPREPIEFGFAVGDGWEPLIRRLAEKLEPIARKTDLRATQVKEKYGELRFYVEGRVSVEVEAAIDAVEEESCHTCEECGAPGKMHLRQGWARTRCDSCWAEFLRACKREKATIAEAPPPPRPARAGARGRPAPQRRRVRVTGSPQEAK